VINKKKAMEKYAVKTSSVQFDTPLPLNGARSDAVKLDTSFKQTEEDGKHGQLPELFIPQQKFVLVNVCHQSQKPRHVHGGFRIIGVFASREEALAYSTDNAHELQSANVYVVPTHEPFPLCVSEDAQGDPARCAALRTEKLNKYAAYLDKTDADFGRKREGSEKEETESRLGSIESLRKQRQAPSQEQLHALNNLKDQLPSFGTCVPEKLGLRDQKSVVVINIPDLTESHATEPLVAVLGVFGTSAEAIRYAKFRAQKQYPRIPIDVVDILRWYHPQGVDLNSLPRHYGDEQLEAIMKRRNACISEVEEFNKTLTAQQRKEIIQEF
jgi:hypothetical protein